MAHLYHSPIPRVFGEGQELNCNNLDKWGMWKEQELNCNLDKWGMGKEQVLNCNLENWVMENKQLLRCYPEKLLMWNEGVNVLQLISGSYIRIQ